MAERKTISKQRAAYEDRAPTDSKECGNCSMFRPPHRCTLVRGVISPRGLCKFWERKR